MTTSDTAMSHAATTDAATETASKTGAPEGPAGLQLFRSMLAGGGVRAGIGELLGMSLLEVDEGRIVFGLEPDARMTNPLGTVHGGIAATLLDSAMSCAVHTTLAADESYTTLDLHVRYVRAARPDGGPLQVEGSVVHRGRRTATAEGRVTDAEGRLVAHGSVSCIVLATP